MSSGIWFWIADGKLEDPLIRDYFPRLRGAVASNRDDVVVTGEVPVQAQVQSEGIGSATATAASDGRPSEGWAAPGEQYKIYAASDVCGIAPAPLQAVVERAAAWTCFGVDGVYALVERYERRLLAASDRARRAQRREAAGGSESK
jgi:hypothetical protein